VAGARAAEEALEQANSNAQKEQCRKSIEKMERWLKELDEEKPPMKDKPE
jgi:hypothetical protein